MAGNAGSIRAGRAFVEIVLDQSKFEKGLRSAQKKIKDFGSSLTAFGTKLMEMAALAGAPFAMAVRTFSSFDDEMRMVKAVTGAVDGEFRMLTDTAEKLGRETSFTAREVAQGMTAMGRMGFKADEINDAIPAVLNLARATGTELGSAAEIAANNMRVFGISTSEMSGVADILTATANGSAQTLTDLAEGLKMAGPQAAAAGDDIRNVAASLGVLANMGIKGSLAGTALRKAYSQFANVNVQKKLAEINISTVDNTGNLRAMPEIMADIGKAMSKMPTAQRLAFAEEIFDLRGALAGLQLGGNMEQLNDFIDMLNGVPKDTTAQVDAVVDAGAVDALKEKLKGIPGVTEAEIETVAKTKGLDGLKEKLKSVSKMTTAEIDTIADTGGIEAVKERLKSIPGVTEAEIEVIAKTNGIEGLKQKLREAMAEIGGVDGIARRTAEEMDKGIGGAMRRFSSALEGVQISVGRIIGDAIAPYMDSISRMLNRLAEWAKAHKAVIIAIAKVIGVALAAGAAIVVLGAAFKATAFAVGVLNTTFVIMKTVVLAPIMAVKMLMGAYHLLTAAIAITKTVAIACWAAISSPAVLAGVAIGAVVAVVWKLTGAWDICAEGVKGLWNDFGKAFSAIGSIFRETWDAIKTAFASGDLAGAAKVALSALKLAWLTGIFPLKKAWLELRNFLSDAWTVTVYSLLKLGNNLWYGLQTGMKNIGDAIADAWAGIWNGICDTFARTCEWLEKKWVQFKGVFDSDAEVDAAVKFVERKYAAAREERDRNFASGVQRRQQERESLSQEWTRSNSSIDEAMNREIMENQAKFGGMIDQAKGEIEAARADWRTAMDAVRESAREKEEKAARAAAKTGQASRGTAEAMRKSGMDGNRTMSASWSLRELRGLIGGSTGYDQRTASASERTVSLQEETNRYLRKIHSRQGSASISYGD